MGLKEVREAHSSIIEINKVKDAEKLKQDEKNSQRFAMGESVYRLYEKLEGPQSYYGGRSTTAVTT